MNPITEFALIMLSISLNFVLVWLILRLLAEINRLKDAMIQMRKIINETVREPKKKVDTSIRRTPERVPLYRR
jgi:hypothetical protein